MMLDEFGTVIAPRTLRIARLLPGPIERVWAFLTESDKRGLWLASGPMEMRVGGSVRLDFLHSSLSAEKEAPAEFKKYEGGVSHHGHITRLEPPHLLAYTWSENEDGTASEVTFRLTRQGERVLLELTHERLPDHGKMVMVASGWHAHLAVLIERLDEREPQRFWSIFESVRPEYDKRIRA
jgi:uncharacterized protein YndB with AHSA1/START domain